MLKESVNECQIQNINDEYTFDRLQDFIRKKLVYVENKLESYPICRLH